MNDMKILVTNDDGIYSKGLWAIAKAMSRLGQVTVIAPDREQSGVGTGVTLFRPLRLNQVVSLVPGVEAYAVEGTPADCVILGLGTVSGDDTSLVVSGINVGANLGNDVLISGTVGAAFQGFCRGIPSLAVSVTSLQASDFDSACTVATFLGKKLTEERLPHDILLNINLPSLPLNEIGGVEVTHLGRRVYGDIVEEREDSRGHKYHWIVRGKPEWELEEGTDIWAIRNHRISITPLHTDLTSRGGLALVQGLAEAFSQDMSLNGHKPARRRRLATSAVGKSSRSRS